MRYDFVPQFTQKLIEQAGLSILPASYLEQYQQQLEEQVVERMGLVALENLNEKGMQEYTELLNAAGDDISKIDSKKIVRICFENIEDFQGIMQKALDELTQEFLQAVKKSNQN